VRRAQYSARERARRYPLTARSTPRALRARTAPLWMRSVWARACGTSAKPQSGAIAAVAPSISS